MSKVVIAGSASLIDQYLSTNPGLNITGVGLVWFPLQTQDFEALENGGYQRMHGITTVLEENITITNLRWSTRIHQSVEVLGRLCFSLDIEMQNTRTLFHSHVNTTYTSGSGFINIIVSPTDATLFTAKLSYAGKILTEDFQGDHRYHTTTILTFADYDYIQLSAPDGGVVPFLIYYYMQPRGFTPDEERNDVPKATQPSTESSDPIDEFC
ncbi:hypothetical protein V5O48_006523 [Marasmius crinis-equi]|uniref:Uncharacterized protein n=1 Tax=Marasmius crinis-equi TaxID=585013 RepID=A0ABR3FJ90_9AGAR